METKVSQIRVNSEDAQVPEIASEPDNTTGMPPSTAIIWQEWTQKRAQHRLRLNRCKKSQKKLNSVTQAILEERRIMPTSFGSLKPCRDDGFQIQHMQ